MTTKMKSSARIAFFGTAPLALGVLDALENQSLTPSLIVAGKDSFNSRTKEVVFPVEKTWAIEHGIPVAPSASSLQRASLDGHP